MAECNWVCSVPILRLMDTFDKMASQGSQVVCLPILKQAPPSSGNLKPFWCSEEGVFG